MCFTFKYRAEKLVKFCETKFLLLEDLEKMIKIEVPMRKWIPYEIGLQTMLEDGLRSKK